ncbi:PREDICTED: LOC109948410, partial [Prunus dulcis]
AEVQLESFSVGADFFYRLVDETEWMSSRHLDMATFLIRKRQLLIRWFLELTGQRQIVAC